MTNVLQCKINQFSEGLDPLNPIFEIFLKTNHLKKRVSSSKLTIFAISNRQKYYP